MPQYSNPTETADRRIVVHPVDPEGDTAEEAFIRFPHRLYHGCSAWVPWFDGADDPIVAEALFDAAMQWARDRGLTTMVGPMLFGGASGSGLLVDGFEHRTAMTMMPYNHAYYRPLVEHLGLQKKIDYHSAGLDPSRFCMPDQVRRVAENALSRGRFNVMRFKLKSELRQIAERIGGLYNDILGDSNESHILTEAEIRETTQSLITVAEASLIHSRGPHANRGKYGTHAERSKKTGRAYLQ